MAAVVALLLILPATTLTAQSSRAKGRWRSVGQSIQGTRWQLDMENLRRSGNVVTGWAAIHLAEAHVDTMGTGSVTQPYTNMLENFRIECDALTFQVLSFQRRDDAGHVVGQTSQMEPVKGVQPETMEELLQRMACRLATRR